MKVIAMLVVAVVALAGCGASSPPDVAPTVGVRTVAPAAAKALIASGDVTVIDVRTPQEFAAGHVVGATNINVEAADFADRIESLDASDAYVVYCRSGRRSAVAAELMKQARFTDVADAGGLDALIAAGVPTQ
jgi:rhodanese-related sulfurtransferase